MRRAFGFRMTIFRPKIVSLMALIAILALAIWSARAVNRHYLHRSIRLQRESMAVAHADQRRMAVEVEAKAPDPEFKRWQAELAMYHDGLEKKYRKGAEAPSTALEPDPPKPPPPYDLDQLDREYDALIRKARSLYRELDRMD